MATTNKAFRVKTDLELAPIEKTLSQLGSGVEKVFVYDTRKDSDGGAWRHRCQHMSWYNEGESSNRSARKEFPVVALIVAWNLIEDSTNHTGRVDIYDLDDPDAPLWMRFVVNGSNASNSMINRGGNPVRGAVMKDGILAVAADYKHNVAGDLRVIRFLHDDCIRISASSSYRGKYRGTIQQRNLQNGFDQVNYGAFSTNKMQDVAITTLPGAPIDPVSQLPVPTIAVANLSGVGVLKDNGDIVNITGNNWGHDSYHVVFNDEGILYFPQMGYYWMSCDVQGLESSSYSLPDGRNYYQSTPDTYPFHQVSGLDNNGWGATIGGGAASTNGDFSFAHYSYYTRPFDRLVRHKFTPAFRGSKFYGNTEFLNYTGVDFNTGWMPPQTIVSALNVTTPETNVDGSDLFPGTWDLTSAGSGWTQSSGDLSYDGTGSLYQKPWFSASTTEGKHYNFTFTLSNFSGGGISVAAYDQVSISNNWSRINPDSNGNFTLSFEARGATTKIIFQNNSSSQSFDVSNAMLRRATADTCKYYETTTGGKSTSGLSHVGTGIDISAAAGGEMCGYADFAGRRLEVELKGWSRGADAPLCMMLWAKPSGTSGSSILAAFNSTQYTGAQFGLTQGWSGFVAERGTNIGYTTNPVQPGYWTFYVICRDRTGTKLYTNGRFVERTGTKYQITSDPILTVGNSSSNDGPFAGSVAMLRVAEYCPTPEQIYEIYHDEREIFGAYADCTIAGDHETIRAIAYDNDTQLLHVGTSNGRSAFQRLVRTEHTPTAVYNSISAVNGIVAEE